MTGILNSSGAPIRPQLSDEQILQAFAALKMRIDGSLAQITNVGLLVEYLYHKLDEAEIKLDLDNFEEWAEQRFEEIQTEAAQMRQAQLEQIKNDAPQTPELNLSDE